MVLAAVMPA